MNQKYVAPKALKTWLVDEADSERHELTILDNGTVFIASGRFAHSSGSSICSWPEFLAGKLDKVVVKAIGAAALIEAKAHLASLAL